MKQSMTLRRGLLAALAVVTLGGAFASPQAAWADGDKGKDKGKKIPIIIAPPIVTPDDPKTPPPPKKKP